MSDYKLDRHMGVLDWALSVDKEWPGEGPCGPYDDPHWQYPEKEKQEAKYIAECVRLRETFDQIAWDELLSEPAFMIIWNRLTNALCETDPEPGGQEDIWN